MAHLHTEYQNRIKEALMEEFGYNSIMEVPKLDKVVINMGVGEASQDRKKIDGALADLTRISGQKPVVTKAKKSIARDFRGVSRRSFDGNGNYAMGLKEQIVFPEIDYDQVDQIRGMDIIICTTAKNDAEARSLLKHFNMPFSN